jgi:head-tail adaptor
MESKTEALAVREEIQPANLLQALVQVATTPGISIDVIERMVALQERQEARQAQTAYMDAMSECQKEIPQIDRSGRIMVKEKLRSTFALHEDIDAAIRPIYTAHGFAVSYDTRPKDAKIEIECKVSHRRGHFEVKTIVLPVDVSDFRSAGQSVGSTLTYAKRQLLGMHFNIVTKGTDNDGQGPAKPITEEQARDLQALMEEVKQDIPRFLKYFEIEKVSDLPAKELAGAIQDLERKRK